MWGKRTCKVSSLLWDYAANRLYGAEADKVEAHLQSCAECRAQLEEYQQTVALVSAYRQERVPQSQTSWHTLRHRLETPERRQMPGWSHRLHSLSWAAGATCVALLLLMASKDLHIGVQPTREIIDLPRQVKNSPPRATRPAQPGSSTTAMVSPDNNPVDTEWDYPQDLADLAEQSPTPTASVHTASIRSYGRSHSQNSAPPRLNSISRREGESGEEGSLAAQPDYVLPPASSSEDEEPRHYVIDTISSTPRTGSEESRTW